VPTPITSPDNPKLRYLRRLLEDRGFRASEGRLAAEGVRLVEAALDAGHAPALSLVAEGLDASERGAALLERLVASGSPVLVTSPALFRAAADTATPQGVLAAFPTPDLPPPSSPALALVLDGWRDPGNLGTALRSAAAADADMALLTPGTVDPWHPRALRAGMGAQFTLPIASVGWADLPERMAGLELWIADASAELAHWAVDWRHPSAILVGGEAEGATDHARALPHRTVGIPMPGAMESLNAASAVAVLVFERLRQRQGA
jgi:TrmH family RNA methyltransferase